MSESQSTQAEVQRLKKVVERLTALTEKYQQAEVVQQALFRISELASSVESMDQLYASVHRIIGQLMDAKNFYICLYSDDRESMIFPYFVDEFDHAEMVAEVPVSSLSRGMTGYLLRVKEPWLCTREDIRALQESGDVDVLGSIPIDWLGVPLMIGDRVIGAMVVQSYSEDMRYQSEDLELLTFVSQHVVNALERFRHREWMEKEIANQTSELRSINENLRNEIEERQKAELQNAVLYAISELTSTTEDMYSFYKALHAQVRKLLMADNFYVALLTDNREQVYFPYYVDQSGDKIRQRKLRRGITEYVIRTGESLLMNAEVRQQLLEADEIEESDNKGHLARQWLGAPLVVDNDIIGVLAVQVYEGDEVYTRDDLELLNFVSQHVAVAIERRRAAEEVARANVMLERRIAERTEELVEEIERRKEIEEQLFHDAHHDTLTALPNRALFTERVEQALNRLKRSPDENFALLFVDLDRFKNINDTLGHSAGDKFLLQVSRRLTDAIREQDLLARFGGDEFVILLDPVNHIDDAKDVASRIIEIMKRPFHLEGQDHFSGASIGITTCRGPEDTVDRMLQDADAAMYEAKNLGRGRYVLFDEAIRSGLVEALSQETAFRHAEVHRDFRLWYQPIYNIGTDQVVGQEVLLRWQQKNELSTPVDFLRIAERSGAILEIDQWVLENVCKGLDDSRASKYPDTYTVHINLSIQHLLRSRHIDKLEEIVRKYDVLPHQIVLEFGEKALMQEDSPRILASLRRLQEFGFLLALDDFGRNTGPLHFIYNYPFDLVKLDHSFVAQVTERKRARAMVRHIVTLCSELDIYLSAEGIEKPEQREMLTSLGVNLGQGRLLEEPKSASYLKQAFKPIPVHAASF